MTTKVFHSNELACQVVNLLADQNVPLFVAEEVLQIAKDFIECQEVKHLVTDKTVVKNQDPDKLCIL